MQPARKKEKRQSKCMCSLISIGNFYGRFSLGGADIDGCIMLKYML
jgi:hypothetical protein